MSAQEAKDYGLVDDIVSLDEAKLHNLNLPPPNKSKTFFGSDHTGEEEEDFEFGKLVNFPLSYSL
jgi:ClpP class serine protease